MVTVCLSFTPCGFWLWQFSTCLVCGLWNSEVGIGIGVGSATCDGAWGCPGWRGGSDFVLDLLCPIRTRGASPCILCFVRGGIGADTTQVCPISYNRRTLEVRMRHMIVRAFALFLFSLPVMAQVPGSSKEVQRFVRVSA